MTRKSGLIISIRHREGSHLKNGFAWSRPALYFQPPHLAAFRRGGLGALRSGVFMCFCSPPMIDDRMFFCQKSVKHENAQIRSTCAPYKKMNTDARSAELAPAPVLHGDSTRGDGHRSALRGTSGNAQCSASRSQVMKPKPEELPACLAACGWRGFTPAL